MSEKFYKRFVALNAVSLALLGVAVGTSILFPEKSANADECTAQSSCTTDITVRVNPVISSSVTDASDDEIDTLNLKIDRPNNATNMTTGAVYVNISTNDPNGYKLYVTTNSSETSLVRSDDWDDEVETLDENVDTSSDDFPDDNRWGYSTDGVIFRPVPALNDYTTAAVNGATGDSTNTITFGARVDDEIVNGHYTNTVLFTAIPSLME